MNAPAPTTPTLAQQHSDRTLDAIIERFGLQELHGPDGGPWLPLTSAMTGGEQVGFVRILHGGPIHKLVTISLGVPMMGLDSHMVFAFTAPDSAVPHFTLDSVQAPAGPPGVEAAPGETYAFHLDLIPRVDLGANLAYIDEVYHPLSPTTSEARKHPGLTPAHLDSRQLSIMSPWMLANRADEDAYVAATDWIQTYLDHWFALVENGISREVLDDLATIDLAERDRRNRAIIFDPDVDAVWAQVARLVGDEASEQARGVLAMQDLPEA